MSHIIGGMKMKKFNLRFYDQRWPDGWIVDLLDDMNEDFFPETSGCYILGSNDGTNFIYPWGTSPIYYIGQSSNIKKRLLEHKKYIECALEDHDELYWWPRYQYGAAFGADVAWYSIRGKQNPNKLESDLITRFYETYGALPVANGTWPSGLRKPVAGSRDDR